jgi:hypothetical protein
VKGRFAVLVAAGALTWSSAGAAQAPTLSGVLTNLRAYLTSYGERYSATVATERYRQTSGRPGDALFRESILESDFGIVRAGGQGLWTGLRDVYRVNGRSVQDRDDRLAKLFSESFQSGKTQATRIAEESARFNIGPVLRTINNPALVLKILDPVNEFRLTFAKEGEEVRDGTRLWVIDFVEHYRPTLVRTADGEDEPSEGRIWVDPVSGRLYRADVNFNSQTPDMGSFTARLSVTFREDAKLGLWVPDRMTERYEGANIEAVTGEATYREYRRFGVETREDFVQ